MRGDKTVRVDPASARIDVLPGDWVVDEHLIFPSGYTVVAGEGVSLDTRDGAGILSHSPLRFLGCEEGPVTVQSTDGTGQGLVVLDAGADSVMRHVVFRGLSTPSTAGWTLTGAVTFYRSPVTFTFCEFDANDSEPILTVR